MRTILSQKFGPQQWAVTLFLTLFFIWFLKYYWDFPIRPGNNAFYKIGWWGWFDQGNYLRAENAIGRFDLSATEYYYPPLYSIFAYIGDFISGSEKFLTVNAVCFAIYMASLLLAGIRIYGVAVCVVPIALFYFYPEATLDQWVIPWTSSLSAALQGILVAIYAGFEYRPKKFVLDAKSDWVFVFGFFIAYGAIFATRPLEVFVFFPLALIFFIKTLSPLLASGAGHRYSRVARFLVLVALGGIAFPISYLMFNRIVFGEWLGGYFANVGANGYQLSFFIEKAVSLIRDSKSLFLEPDSALSDHFQIAFVAFPIVLATALTSFGCRRIIAATICLNFAIYFPYGDLVPYGLFHYDNVHYFKWAIPWCAVIAAGQLLVWTKDIVARRWFKPAIGIAVSCLFAFAMAGAKIIVPHFDYFYDSVDSDTNSVSIDLGHIAHFRILDLAADPQAFEKVYLGNFRVWIDGKAKRTVRDFRALQAPWGIRIIFPSETSGQKIQFQAQPNTLRLSSGPSIARIGDEKVTLLCRWTSCPKQEFLPPKSVNKGKEGPPAPLLTIPFSLHDPDSYLMGGWSGPEECCRWTTDLAAEIVVPPQLPQPHRLEAVVSPLLTPSRPRQVVRVRVNGCVVVETAMEFPEDIWPNRLTGEIPSACVSAGGQLRVAFETDDIARPIDIGVNQDERTLGVSVAKLSLW